MNRRQFLKLSAAGVVAGIIGSYPIFIERYMVQVNRYRIPVPRLPRQFDGFTIVQLTDLHYGPLVSRSFLEEIIGKANSLRKDVIVCTGDFVHSRNTAAEINGIWPLLAKLQAPLGVYSVLGNHDHWADAERSAYWLERSGQDISKQVRCIEREGERLWLAGGGDLWEDHANVDQILDNVPEEECRIMIAHNPDSADTSFSRAIDLMVCGHTHGGQVKIPFLGTPVLPVKNKNYSAGLKTSPKGQPVFISKGIGWAIYPIRFNCRPEIAVLELRSSPA